MDAATSFLREFTSVVLSDGPTESPSWSTGVVLYHEWLSRVIMASDPDLVEAIGSLAASIRSKYLSFAEYNAKVTAVPPLKTLDPCMRDKMADDCPICLKHLQGMHPVCRLRSGPGQSRCGHIFHAACIAKLRPDPLSSIARCPVCRADVGWPVRVWHDIEHETPEY